MRKDALEFGSFVDWPPLPSFGCRIGKLPPVLGTEVVTTWIEKGFHTAEASYMAGHSSQKVTEKYTHLTAKRLKEKMDRLG